MARGDAKTSVGERRVVSRPRSSSSDAELGAVPRGLRIERGDRSAHVALREDARYVVGRHDAADIGFDHESVSRLHGVLRGDASGWSYEDWGSSNGSRLWRDGDERALSSREPLVVFSGDEIELGDGGARLVLLPHAPPEEEPVTDATQRSVAARAFERQLDLAARTRVPVFLLGPSGAGKTHAARRVHDKSRSLGRFVSLNCARLPQDAAALHSELLGHVKGAFTGADAARTGRLVHADGGTLFLDEVESLSELAQGFLLDVLEGTGDSAPLGSKEPSQSTPIFRLVSASKKPLGESGLRADLCERLAEGHMWRLPTLAERRADIAGLVSTFAREQSVLLGVEVEVRGDLVAHAEEASWPGQIRQLKAAVVALAQLELARLELEGKRPALITLDADALAQHLAERRDAFGVDVTAGVGAGSGATPPATPRATATRGDARQLRREDVLAALEATDGNQSEAARFLGIARNTLARKMKQFGIERVLRG
jgi:DNA-binding NtrC family response regulator